MISESNTNNIENGNIRKKLSFLLVPLIFLSTAIISYNLGFEYSDKTALFNDKLIDVSSIFFGIFLGCLGLFEKFKNDATYNKFLGFSRRLLLYNIFLIAFSFVIILMDTLEIVVIEYSLNQYKLTINPKVLFFSIYIASFAAVIANIIKLVKIIFIILESRR